MEIASVVFFTVCSTLGWSTSTETGQWELYKPVAIEKSFENRGMRNNTHKIKTLLNLPLKFTTKLITKGKAITTGRGVLNSSTEISRSWEIRGNYFESKADVTFEKSVVILCSELSLEK